MFSMLGLGLKVWSLVSGVGPLRFRDILNHGPCTTLKETWRLRRVWDAFVPAQRGRTGFGVRWFVAAAFG